MRMYNVPLNNCTLDDEKTANDLDGEEVDEEANAEADTEDEGKRRNRTSFTAHQVGYLWTKFS